MAKFDIANAADVIGPGGRGEANYEPSRPRAGLPPDSIRMRGTNGVLRPIHRGRLPHVGTIVISAMFLVGAAAADPVAIAPDVPAKTEPAPSAMRPLPPSWDLDGLYLWLGPIGAAGWQGSSWDSTFGGDATVVRVREHESLGAVGATL